MKIVLILVGIFIFFFGLSLLMGYALRKDLKDLEKLDPSYRKWIKDKFKI